MHDETAAARGGPARVRCLVAMGLGGAGMVAFYGVASRQGNQGYAAFAVCWVVLGLLSLALALRSLARKDFGSAAAWTTCALPLLAIAAALSISLMFTNDAAGVVVVSADRGYWFPFLFFTCSVLVLMAAIRAVKVAGREA